MRKVIVLSFVLLFMMGASLANALPNIASPSVLGSVLYYPYVDTRDGTETYIMISNDANTSVSLKCYWVKVGAQLEPAPGCQLSPAQMKLLPPTQSPADFGLDLTRNQAIMFSARDGEGDPNDPRPIGVQGIGSEQQGYLVCFAVNYDNAQIKFDYLSGTATVVTNPNPGLFTALEYPSWNYPVIKGGAIKSVVGMPGTIKLDGSDYAATPQYLTFAFPAVGYGIFDNIHLKLVQGSQNFNTMAFNHHVTRATFALWNENEIPFTNLGVCAWCYLDTWLYNDSNEPSLISNNQNFHVDNLHSSVGRIRITTAASNSCRPDYNLTGFQKDMCFGAATTFEAVQTGLLGIGIQHYNTDNDISLILPVGARTGLADTITFTP